MFDSKENGQRQSTTNLEIMNRIICNTSYLCLTRFEVNIGISVLSERKWAECLSNIGVPNVGSKSRNNKVTLESDKLI